MVLTAQQQFMLRAKKALNTGDKTFKPRGKNKEIFETMKQEHEKTRAHTTSESNRIIKETTAAVLNVIGQNTQPLPDQIQIATRMAGPSTAVRVLNSILRSEGLQCKGTKSDKAAFLARNIPTHELLQLLDEHRSSIEVRAKSSASATAAAAGEERTDPTQQAIKEQSSSPSSPLSSQGEEDSTDKHEPTHEAEDKDLKEAKAAGKEDEYSKNKEQKSTQESTPQQLVDAYLKRKAEEEDNEAKKEQRIEADVDRIMRDIDAKSRKVFPWQ